MEQFYFEIYDFEYRSVDGYLLGSCHPCICIFSFKFSSIRSVFHLLFLVFIVFGDFIVTAMVGNSILVLWKWDLIWVVAILILLSLPLILHFEFNAMCICFDFVICSVFVGFDGPWCFWIFIAQYCNALSGKNKNTVRI